MLVDEKQQQMVLNNMRFVRYLVQKLGVSPKSSDYDDIVSIGEIGLIKAVSTFDESKGNKFSTYASRCINNEIFMHYRKTRKISEDISLDDPIGDDEKGNELTLMNKIASSESNFIEKIEYRETLIALIEIILNCLEPREQIIMFYRISGIKQCDIAKILNISQSYIARLERSIAMKIRKIFDENIQYDKVYCVDIKGDTYIFIFDSKAFRDFNIVFAKFLNKLTLTADLQDFKVSCNKESIRIYLPVNSKTFFFIGKIIQETDNFGEAILPNEPATSSPESVQNAQKPVKNEPKVETKKSEARKTENKSKNILEYMRNIDSFSFTELVNKFPDLTRVDIFTAIRSARKQGWVTINEEGRYIVTKI